MNPQSQNILVNGIQLVSDNIIIPIPYTFYILESNDYYFCWKLQNNLKYTNFCPSIFNDNETQFKLNENNELLNIYKKVKPSNTKIYTTTNCFIFLTQSTNKNEIKLVYSHYIKDSYLSNYEKVHCTELQKYINKKIAYIKNPLRCICKDVDVLLTTNMSDSFPIINTNANTNIYFSTYMNECNPYYNLIPHIAYFNNYILNNSIFNPGLEDIQPDIQKNLTDKEKEYFKQNKLKYLYFIKDPSNLGINYYINSTETPSYINELDRLVKDEKIVLKYESKLAYNNNIPYIEYKSKENDTINNVNNDTNNDAINYDNNFQYYFPELRPNQYVLTGPSGKEIINNGIPTRAERMCIYIEPKPDYSVSKVWHPDKSN